MKRSLKLIGSASVITCVFFARGLGSRAASGEDLPVDAPLQLQSETPLASEASVAAGQHNQRLSLQCVREPSANRDNIIVIDDDELNEPDISIEQIDAKTDAGGSKLLAGARFPVVLNSELRSNTAKVGDPLQARLKYDLKIGDRMVAARGSVVRGHVDYVLRARTPLACSVSAQRWTMTSGCLGIKFDEIINERSEHIPLVAEPSRTAVFIRNNAEGRLLGINHKGRIAAPYSMQVKYNAVRMGLNAAAAPAGVLSFGAMPLALGIMGAANPSFAFGKPVGHNVRHRRLKGFFWGALSGLPGSWLIEGTTVKGEEVILKPGDQFLAELQTDFTGQASSEAEVLPAVNTEVRGKVLKNKGAEKRL